jgi:hypothetical protein
MDITGTEPWQWVESSTVRSEGFVYHEFDDLVSKSDKHRQVPPLLIKNNSDERTEVISDDSPVNHQLQRQLIGLLHDALQPTYDQSTAGKPEYSNVPQIRRVKSNESIASTRSRVSTRSNNGRLCERCESYNLLSFFAQADSRFTSASEATPDGFRIVDLRGRLSARTRCSLCQFMTDMKTGPIQSLGFQLRAFPSLEASHFIDYSKMPHGRATNVQRAYLAVVPNDQVPDIQIKLRQRGCIYRALPDDASPDDHDSIWGRSLGPTADMNIARTWLRICRNNHKGTCSRSTVRKFDIPDFRLIDCLAKPPKLVLRTSREHYVALSYVWGTQAGGDDPWPRVIQDAVEVTKSLGFRYLWVDRYCIDQNATAQRHHLIMNMDSVYEGAEVTLIDAAGKNADSGLPGIGSTSRRLQPKITLGGMTLVSSMKDPRLLIENSPWYSRGWTYQEGILSRRRLIFTRDQMFWDCRAMIAQESIHIPLSLSHTSARDHMGSWMRSGVFDTNRGSQFVAFSVTPSSGTISFDKLSLHVNAYTGRNLTKDTDSLLAFKGIIKRYDSQEVRFIFGLPVFLSGNGSILSTFVLAVSDWAHESVTAEKSTAAPPFQHFPRREHLPSWTWAGWRGAVRFPMYTDHTRGLILESTETSARLYTPHVQLSMNQQQVVLDLADMESLPESIDTDLDHYLGIVDPLVIAAKQESVRWSGDHLRIGSNSFARIFLKFTISLSACKTKQTFDRWIETNELAFVLLYWSQGEYPLTKFLILRKSRHTTGDGKQLWSRIGTMQSLQKWYGSFHEYLELNSLVQWTETIWVG